MTVITLANGETVSYPPPDEILCAEVEARLEPLNAEDADVVRRAMAGLSPLAQYELIESFFTEDEPPHTEGVNP